MGFRGRAPPPLNPPVGIHMQTEIINRVHYEVVGVWVVVLLWLYYGLHPVWSLGSMSSVVRSAGLGHNKARTPNFGNRYHLGGGRLIVIF